jgi:virginiamycin B lyase
MRPFVRASTRHALSSSLLLAALAAPIAAQTAAIDQHEWTVPWEKSRPRDPAVDAQRRVWFVGQEGNYVAYLDPSNGQFRRYEVDPGTNPHNLIIDRGGKIWYSGNRNGMIGRLDPATGAITRYPMPDPAAKDPHTMVFDRRGDIWFTVQGGNFVGHLATSTGKIRLAKIAERGARPYGIAIDSKNRPWFDLFGTNMIGTIDPATMAVREFPLPHDRARPRRIAITSDDKVWYVDYSRGMLGRLDPTSGAVKEWPAPAGAQSLPYAMTVDEKDRLWFVETGRQPNRLVGFDPKTNAFFGLTDIASGGLVVRYMIYDRNSGQIWFGTDANTIGRATVVPKPRPVSLAPSTRAVGR